MFVVQVATRDAQSGYWSALEAISTSCGAGRVLKASEGFNDELTRIWLLRAWDALQTELLRLRWGASGRNWRAHGANAGESAPGGFGDEQRVTADVNGYEAHQKARTFASRYVKSGHYDVAVDVLFQSARELLKAGQQGSGTDLAVMMLDVYESKDQGVDDESRGRLTQLIALLGSGQSWRKTVVDKSIAWSAKHGECPTGDPDLHHYIGELLYKDGAFAQAEVHLLSAGKRDSARILGQMFAEWASSSPETIPSLFAARAVFPYLETENILAARAFLASFLQTLPPAERTVLPVGETGDEIHYTPRDPALNFLQLAVLTLQRAGRPGMRDAWVRLYGSYQARDPRGLVAHPEVRKTIQNLSMIYFGIQPPRPAGNPFGDILSGLFGGGGGPAPGGAGRGRPRPAVGLD